MIGRWPAALAAAGLLLLVLALYWPGYATYDSVVQYQQVLAGQYDDWHPPVMARLWALLDGARLGTAPLFVLQLALYWLGLGLLAERLRRLGRPRAGWLVLALGLLPPVIGWQAVVLKDGQMLGALLAATGLAGWWRLAGRAIPRPIWCLIALLLAYAMLLRANAAFAVMPFAVLLAMPGALRWRQGVIMLCGILAVLVLSPLVNHRLLGASDAGSMRSLPIYDLAGIAVRTGDALPQGAPLRARACVTPLYWDTLGDGACGDVTAAWQAMPPGPLYRLLATRILQHPLAYAGQRLSHLNSTLRWLVPAGWPNAAPPRGSEPERLGLAAPGRLAAAMQAMLGWLTATPLGWPLCWLPVAGLALVTAIRSPSGGESALPLALAVSALALEASFALVSIASDLRYHLWAMMAAGLALILSWDRVRRSDARLCLILLAGLILTGTIARVVSV